MDGVHTVGKNVLVPNCPSKKTTQYRVHHILWEKIRQDLGVHLGRPQAWKGIYCVGNNIIIPRCPSNKAIKLYIYRTLSFCDLSWASLSFPELSRAFQSFPDASDVSEDFSCAFRSFQNTFLHSKLYKIISIILFPWASHGLTLPDIFPYCVVYSILCSHLGWTPGFYVIFSNSIYSICTLWSSWMDNWIPWHFFLQYVPNPY